MIIPMLIAIGNLRPETTLLPRAFRRNIKKFVFSLTFLFITLTFACTPIHYYSSDKKASSSHLVVLHTNDTHGHPLKFFHYPAPDVGGLPARATLVEHIRRENDNVLLLDAGDLNTGMAESNLFKAKPDLIGYNYIGYDAMVLGNHEFDNPPAVLKKQMELADFPFLSANVKTKDGEYLAEPYIIKEFDDFTVAIFGLTTKETEIIGDPEHIKDIVFEDEIKVANRLVPELQKKADIIIALVHMGIYESSERGSQRLASKVSGIDLIIDGHTHTMLERPVFVETPDSDHPTVIVQAWQWGLVLGRVDLWIKNKKIIDITFEAIPINLKKVEEESGGTQIYQFLGEPINEDDTLLSLLQPYKEKAEEVLSETIGHSEGMFDNTYTRERETALGDIIADSMLWYTKNSGTDFAIQNAGGIKTDLQEGPVTRKIVYELLPFDNSLVVVTLRGTDVQALFAHIAGISQGEGAFPQVSEGLYFTINRRAKKCEHIFIHGHPLDPKKNYKIVTNSYLSKGGDGYKIFLKAIDTYDTSVFQQEAFIEYIAHLGGSIKPQLKGRIRITCDFINLPKSPSVDRPPPIHVPGLLICLGP